MKPPNKLVRLNLHLRPDHLNRLTTLACALSQKTHRSSRLAEALELALIAGLSWDDHDRQGGAPLARLRPHYAGSVR